MGYPHAAESFRDWAKTTCQLSSSTINGRLRTIRKFYAWAHRYGLIASMPFDMVDAKIIRKPPLLAHVQRPGSIQQTSSLMLKESQTVLKFLSKQQFLLCLKVIANPSHRLMFRLALQTGMRSEELRSFPEKYLFDIAGRNDLAGQAKVRLALHVSDMRLKGGRNRDIDMPLSLLDDLWRYTVLERPRRANRSPTARAELFLTEHGNPYSESAIERVFTSISKSVGFHVTPHMLRHTYATYTLDGLQKRGFKGDALMYVRDRLGHSSIHTTEIYLHLLRQFDANLMLMHEEEINTLFWNAA